MHPLKQLIRNKVDVAGHLDTLADPDSDLQSLL